MSEQIAQLPAWSFGAGWLKKADAVVVAQRVHCHVSFEVMLITWSCGGGEGCALECDSAEARVGLRFNSPFGVLNGNDQSAAN